MSQNQIDKKVWGTVSALGIVIALFLFWWIYYKETSLETYGFVFYLPYLNCFLNALTSIFLVIGFKFIKSKKIAQHKVMMVSAGVTSALFLVSYLSYHHFVGDTKFLGQGVIRPIYFFILISHIVLSIIQVPCILATFFFAFTSRVERHKKIAKITFPIWLYVSVTGIVVFILLKNYS